MNQAPVTAQAIKRFEVGKTYSCRSVCDHDCVWTYTVRSRSKNGKSVMLRDENGELSMRRIKVFGGVETCAPRGSYSMAPTLRAG